MTAKGVPGAFPTVDVPDHAHYTIGAVILIVGITGTLGNFLVIYVFCRYLGLDFFKILKWMNLAAAGLCSACSADILPL